MFDDLFIEAESVIRSYWPGTNLVKKQIRVGRNGITGKWKFHYNGEWVDVIPWDDYPWQQTLTAMNYKKTPIKIKDLLN